MDDLERDAREALIRQRARTLSADVIALTVIGPRTCSYCTLVYRHQVGVLRRGVWFCDRACAAQGRRSRRLRDQRVALTMMLMGPLEP
jgi:hypothetical protein